MKLTQLVDDVTCFATAIYFIIAIMITGTFNKFQMGVILIINVDKVAKFIGSHLDRVDSPLGLD